MPAVGRLVSIHPAPSLGSHNFEMAAIESNAEIVFEVRIDDGTIEREVAVPQPLPAKVHTRRSLAYHLAG